MPPHSNRKVLLVGWDAADWKMINPLMDAGRMPHISGLVENGAMAQLATLNPPLSPMLWTSIATGKRPFKHGIHGFTEPAPGGHGVQPITNLSRKCKAVWNILNQNDLRSTVIGWWPSHPAEPLNGVTISDHYHRANAPIRGKDGPLREIWPMLNGTVHPPRLTEQLAELRFHPDELVVSMLEPFVPLVAEIDQKKDRRLAGMMKTLCECVSIHSAATWLLENEPWDFFAVYFDAIDHFCHGFMKYHPPRRERISERDFELYQNVVTQAYVLHDQMLGTLLQKARAAAGDELCVLLLSDHGFHPDHMRPNNIPSMPAGPAIEHSDFGIFVLSGPGIRKDERIYGASVLDIAPTVLNLFGLPAAADMDGRVLTGAFERNPDIEAIPSWEDVPGNDGRHPPHLQLDAVAAREAMEQMIALGYIDRPDENNETAIENAIGELRYNLGEAYQDDARHYEAAEIFRSLYNKDPDEERYAVRYFISCQALGLKSEMRRIVEDLDGRRRALFVEASDKLPLLRETARTRFEARKAKGEQDALDSDNAETADPDRKFEPLLEKSERVELAHWRKLVRYQPPLIEYLKGQLAVAEKRYDDALASLEQVTGAYALRPGLLIQTGDLYRRLGRFRDARRAYERATEIDPDNPHAQLGLCRLDLRRRQWESAADHALNCLQRVYHNPAAHFLLGVALAGMGNYERAREAYQAAIGINPNFPRAHRRLAMLLEKRFEDSEAAREHWQLADEMHQQRRKSAVRHAAKEPAATAPLSGISGGETMSVSGAAPVAESVIVVSGLPRSGTSMLMQMLSAGGVPVLSDGLRTADEDNPRGYFEFEPVKKLLENSAWLRDAKGKAIKIVAPLLRAIPQDVPCRVILIERDLDEILDSQAKMIERRGENVADTEERRSLLKSEFTRTMESGRRLLSKHPATGYLILRRTDVLRDPRAAAGRIAEFLDGAVEPERMAGVVDISLNRNWRRGGDSNPR